jgi:uncharacterized damage-inducible protein DinB
MLDSWLDFHQATLLTKCEGLTDEQLKTRSVSPSSLSLLGLVRHMTEVERNWFRRVLGAEHATALYCSDENKDGDFDDVEAADAAGDMARFRDELDRCRRVAAEHPDLDTATPTCSESASTGPPGSDSQLRRTTGRRPITSCAPHATSWRAGSGCPGS